MKSIISNANKCYYCGSNRNLEKHHCLLGTANRRKADKDGLWVYLCHDCHQDVHNYNTIARKSLQKEAQKAYERTHSREEFMERYHFNYLWEEEKNV